MDLGGLTENRVDTPGKEVQSLSCDGEVGLEVPHPVHHFVSLPKNGLMPQPESQDGHPEQSVESQDACGSLLHRPQRTCETFDAFCW